MNARLTAIFQDNLGEPVPECLRLDFTGAEDE